MPTCPVLARVALVLLAGCGAPPAPLAPAPTPVEAPPMPTPPTTPDATRAPTSTTLTIPTPYTPDSGDVRGRGSAHGLDIEVVENVEKRTMEGNSIMRVGLRLRANGATETVTLYSDDQPRVTWGGYTIEYRGGWRNEVALVISLAPAGPAPVPTPSRPGGPPPPTPPPAPTPPTVSIPARARPGVSRTASVLGLDIEVKDVIEKYMSSGGTTMVINLELRAGGATTQMTLDSGEHARQSWRGYTLEYTGGWRDTVDLVVTPGAP